MNQGYAYGDWVNAGGASLLDYLSHRYCHSSPATWRARIEAGEVHVDGVAVSPEHPLRAGQHVVWYRPPWSEPAVPLAFAILHRDEHLLAVAKPSGLPTMPAGGFLEHTLLHQVRRVHPEAVPLHRLGRGTSGLVLFARSPLARRAAAAAWRDGRVVKVYRALVVGRPPRASFVIDVPIGRVPHPKLGTVHAAAGDGRAARTDVEVLGSSSAGTIVAATIHTGRPHQIRIHLAAAGHPLLGDPLYATGGGLRERPALPGESGYHLHAERLELAHPASGAWTTIECMPPPMLRVDHPGGECR